MDVVTEDICKILDYLITEYNIVDNGKIIDTYFNIRNEEGIIFSQNFTNLNEPFEILCSIELTLKSMYLSNDQVASNFWPDWLARIDWVRPLSANSGPNFLYFLFKKLIQ